MEYSGAGVKLIYEKNHKPLEKWAKPNLTPSVPPRPAKSDGGFSTWWYQIRHNYPPFWPAVQEMEMEKIFKQKNFKNLVWAPLGSRVNICIHFCLQVHFKVSAAWYCSHYLPPMSTKQGELVAKFAAGVADTGGKFAAGVNNTGGKFATGVNDAGGKLPPVSMTPVENLPPVWTTPVANNGNKWDQTADKLKWTFA